MIDDPTLVSSMMFLLATWFIAVSLSLFFIVMPLVREVAAWITQSLNILAIGYGYLGCEFWAAGLGSPVNDWTYIGGNAILPAGATFGILAFLRYHRARNT